MISISHFIARLFAPCKTFSTFLNWEWRSILELQYF